MDEELLPVDPDEDDLPNELARHPGPFTIVGTDEDGNVFEAPISRAELAAAFAERRRQTRTPDHEVAPTARRR
jgi:hypothetical protein